MSNSTDQAADIKKLGQLIDGIKNGMLTTAQSDGTLRSRPMASQQTEFDGDLWFFTHADDPKVDEVEHEHHVNVSFASPEDNRYVSVSGTARLVRDAQKNEELWKPALKAWFPKGLEDPDLALLKVHVTQAEYWDTASSTFVHLAGFVKATVTGQAYHAGENEKIDLDKES